MTTELAARRRGRALMLGIVAAALIATAFVTLAIEARSSRPDQAAGAVVPGLAEQVRNAQRISVTSHEATYRIEKGEHGWVMRDRGDYPVQVGPVESLLRGLSELQYVRRMTSDPAKLARLGVDDPRQNGRGVLLQVEDGRGAYLVNLILGVQTNGLYVRRPDQDQTWAARGDLPPLRDVASWLDLKPFEMSADQIARVEIAPATGAAYVMQRTARGSPDFTIVGRGEGASPSAVAAAAEHITELEPVDVQPAPAVQGVATAHVRAHTFDGVVIEGELIPSENRTWLKLVARAENPSQEQAAQAINNRAAGWAYALSEHDLSALVTPLADLLPAPAPRVAVTPATPAP